MTDVVIDLPTLHEKQLEIARSKAKYRTACCGRRGGKSLMAIGLGVYAALVDDETVWWCVPTHKNALKSWDELMKYAYKVPGATVNKEEKEINFPGGGSIRVVSMQEYDNVRGSGIDFLIFDEAAFAAEEAWTMVLTPMLLDNPKSRVLFISTPNGFNWFWKMYKKGESGVPGYASFHFTTWDNPHIPRENLEEAKRDMPPQVYAQEIMAEFTDSAGAVFTGVEYVLQPEPPKYNPIDVYVMGIDWGRKHDFTAISVWNSTLRSEQYIDRFNQIGFAFQSQKIAALVEEYNVSVIYAEENGIGLPNVERLQDMGLPVEAFKMTASSKKPTIEALALAIDQQTVTLLDNEVWNNELYSYRTTVTPGGMIKYSAPDGGFDDTVIARALAYHAIGVEVGDIIDITKYLDGMLPDEQLAGLTADAVVGRFTRELYRTALDRLTRGA